MSIISIVAAFVSGVAGSAAGSVVTSALGGNNNAKAEDIKDVKNDILMTYDKIEKVEVGIKEEIQKSKEEILNDFPLFAQDVKERVHAAALESNSNFSLYTGKIIAANNVSANVLLQEQTKATDTLRQQLEDAKSEIAALHGELAAFMARQDKFVQDMYDALRTTQEVTESAPLEDVPQTSQEDEDPFSEPVAEATEAEAVKPPTTKKRSSSRRRT